MLPHLPLIAQTVAIVSTSIAPPPVLVTLPMPLERDAKVDIFVEELLQYVIKVFFSFFEYCVTSILKGRSFASIATLLNHYTTSIEKISGKEKATPYKLIVTQLQNYAGALLKICGTNKSEIVEATFRRFLEEQLRLREEAQRRKDAQQAHINEIRFARNS